MQTKRVNNFTENFAKRKRRKDELKRMERQKKKEGEGYRGLPRVSALMVSWSCSTSSFSIAV